MKDKGRGNRFLSLFRFQPCRRAARHGDAMREEPCKTYGHLFPADQRTADAVGAVLSDWNIPECTELEGDIFRISFEGVFFPLDDVLDALRPLLCAESSGKST